MAQSFQQAYAQLTGRTTQVSDNGVTPFQQAYQQEIQQNKQKSVTTTPALDTNKATNSGGLTFSSPQQSQAPGPIGNIQGIFKGVVGKIGSTIGTAATAGVKAIKALPEAHFADTISQYTPKGFAGAATAFGASLAQGLINTPAEAYKGAVSFGEHNVKGTSTPQQQAADIASAIQLPLLFIGGGEVGAIKQTGEQIAKQTLLQGTKTVAKSVGREALVGGGFGLLGGLQSGKDINNASDYLKNLVANIGIGAGVGAGTSALTHGIQTIVAPLAKGLDAKLGAVFIKNATTKPTISEIHLDPKVAQGMVLSNDLEKTPVGKAIIKTSLDAQQQDAHVAITPQADGKYTLPGGEKVNVNSVAIYSPNAHDQANLAASSGESAGELSSGMSDAAGISPEGTNLPSEKRSTVTNGVPPSATRNTFPSKRTNFEETFGITTPSQEHYTKYFKESQAQESYVFQGLHDVTKALGADAVYRLKTQESLQKKLARKEGRTLATMNDTLGSTIAVKDVADVPKAIDLLKQHFKVTHVDDFRENPGFLGYRAIHADVELPNGQIAEIQINTKDGLHQKEVAHEIYDKWRKYIEDNGNTTIDDVVKSIHKDHPEDVQKFLDDVARSNEIYEGKHYVPNLYKEAVDKRITETHDRIKEAVAENTQQTPEEKPHASKESNTETVYRRGELDTKNGGYFAAKGMSTYHDPEGGAKPYQLKDAKIVTSDSNEAKAVIKEALKDPGNSPEDIKKMQESLTDGFIDYRMNDEIPSIVKAAKKLGYDGIKVWENDDVGNPSSIFVWNTKKVTSGEAQAGKEEPVTVKHYDKQGKEITDKYKKVLTGKQVEAIRDVIKVKLDQLRGTTTDEEHYAKGIDELVKDIENRATGDKRVLSALRTELNKEMYGMVGTTGDFKKDHKALQDMMKLDDPMGKLVSKIDDHVKALDEKLLSTPDKTYEQPKFIKERQQKQTGLTGAQEPVGTGKQRKSALYKHFVEDLAANDPELFDQIKDKPDVLYNKVNQEYDFEKAFEFVEKDPQKAYNVAKGYEAAPEGIRQNSIARMLAETAKQEKNTTLMTDVVNSLSLRATRQGQEIYALKGWFTNDSPQAYMKKLIDIRLRRLGGESSLTKGVDMVAKKFGKNLDSAKTRAFDKIDKAVVRAQEKIKKQRNIILNTQKLLDELTCK